MKIVSFILLGACALLMCMCALHPPASEMLMFKDERDTGIWGGGVVYCRSFFDKKTFENKAITTFEDQTQFVNFDVVNIYKNGVAAQVVHYPQTFDGAISMTLGYPIGMDLTGRIWEKTYMTLGFGGGGYQAILQRPILIGRWSLASGIYYRHEIQYFDITRSSTHPYEQEIVDPYYTDTRIEKSAGLRCILALFPQFGTTPNNTGFYTSLNAGYSFFTDQIVYQWSFHYGLY